jgi:hypothetical protein
MADVKISDLTAKAAALATTDTLEINESGTSKSVTGANIIDAIAAATQTLTNKTFDANATGNSLSNVDVADLSNGTDGELITWNASGVATVVSVGTDGQVLTSTGAGSPPAFEAAAAGGAWTLISTVVASNSATLTVTGLDTTYSTYALGFANLHPATNQAKPAIRLGDSGGIDSGGSDYSWLQMGDHVDSTVFGLSGSMDQLDSLMRVGEGTGNNAGAGHNGIVFLSTPGTCYPSVSGTVSPISDSLAATISLVGGTRKSVISVTQVQFLFTSGDIVSGRFSVWGISHA